MGRYYTGDIEGKLWFGVQDSNAADRFGVIGEPPTSYLEYYFDADNLPAIEEELLAIENTIGAENLSKLDTFFMTENGYNDEILKKHGILEIWNTHKRDYADLQLGKQIRACILKQGYCGFEAEL